MQRPLFVLVAAAVLGAAGCGNDDDGGAAASAPPGISGTLFGQPFTAADSSALVLPASGCNVLGFNANATGLVLGFGSFQGLCSFVTQNAGCANKANATLATVVIVRANALGGNPGPVQPGTYGVAASTPLPDTQGNITIAQAIAAKNDATCQPPAATPRATSGTVRIDAIGTRVTGTADLTFASGDRLAGTFDVPVCAFQTDVCTVLSGMLGPTCTGTPACL
jgi:hypothetical protein